MRGKRKSVQSRDSEFDGTAILSPEEWENIIGVERVRILVEDALRGLLAEDSRDFLAQKEALKNAYKRKSREFGFN